MHITATVPLPASPVDIWQILADPAAASACVPGLRQWEPMDSTGHFRLWINWRDAPEGIPVILIWESMTPPSSFTVRAEVLWANTAVPATSTIHLTPAGPASTDLTFHIDLHTTNKLIMQMAANILPKTADAFFTCLKKQLPPPPHPHTTDG